MNIYIQMYLAIHTDDTSHDYDELELQTIVYSLTGYVILSVCKPMESRP